MVHIPILRSGRAYASLEKVTLVHHATGQPVATVSQANSGLVARDLGRMDDSVLERFTAAELIAFSQRAAHSFVNESLPLGDGRQSFDDYLTQLSATTGMPVTYCRANAEKVCLVLTKMETILAGLTRGLDPTVLDNGTGMIGGQTVSFYRSGRLFGAVLPSNSPGVHGLWLPAVALKTPVVLKPGREEPWTPYRLIQAFISVGVPREAFSLYPTDHAGAGEVLRGTSRSMLFGDTTTTSPWKNDPRVELHGPGFSKVLLGEDAVDDWEQHVDLMVSSISANCGRSCINASGVWTPRRGREIAESLASRFADVQALPADDPNASIAAFANADMARRISDMIDGLLRVAGAEDVTQRVRGRSRLVLKGRCAWLLPTIVYCEDRNHPLANREFLFPFASVVECPTEAMPEAIGPSLVVSAITRDSAFTQALMNTPNVDRLNIGALPTWKISWDQPHEGNLFEHLYKRRAFQTESVA